MKLKIKTLISVIIEDYLPEDKIGGASRRHDRFIELWEELDMEVQVRSDLIATYSRPTRKPTLWTVHKVSTRSAFIASLVGEPGQKISCGFSVSGIFSLYLYLPETECVSRL